MLCLNCFMLQWKIAFIFKFFMIFAVISSIMSYMSIDPMKSSFFLICSLLCTMPLISFSMYIWFSYFICLLFLSGIFVILVYFSSLSSFSAVESNLVIICMLLSFFFFLWDGSFNISYVNLSSFYCKFYWYIFFYILMVLLFFMNFSSYFLNFSGALRKL